jgi:hypothetical protein
LRGPKRDRITGRSIKPLLTPNIIIPNHILKKTSKIYDLDPERTMIAKNVEKAPWNTLGPIYPRAPLALSTLF